MPEERLQKILARAGLGSRRACEALIQAGRVTVDGRVVTELGLRVDPSTAEIRVDGQRVMPERFRYIMLYKPAGYLSSPDPRAGLPSWTDLVRVPERLYAVGRLDHDSEGLLLLTNDGDLALRLMHPRYGHVKTYLVEVEGVPTPRKVRRWQHGVMLDDGPTLPAEVEVLRASSAVLAGHLKGATVPTQSLARQALASGPTQKAGVATGSATGQASAPGPRGQLPTRDTPSPPGTTWLRFRLREGRKRQLRRMVALLGHPALRVIRVGLGPLVLGELRPGQWRDLTPGEVRALREAAFGGEPAEAPPILPGKEDEAFDTDNDHH